MCYLEDCVEVVEYMNTCTCEHTTKSANQPVIKPDYNIEINTIEKAEEEDAINYVDLDIFFRSIGSIFITYITSSTLNNLLLSKVIRHTHHNNILYNNSLLKIFSSQMDMIERCILFNKQYGELNNISMECTIWNLSYFNILNNKYFKYLFAEAYNHKMMMKMMISYICINGMHPFLGIDCDSSPNCQWSDNPKCRIRLIFEKLLANKDSYNINKYDFGYRNAWKMRSNESNLLIDINEMMQFLFTNTENDDDEIGDYDIFDMDAFESFENNKFTLFSFLNECDYTYKIQFDIIHCDQDLNVIDNFNISLFGKKIRFGSFPFGNNKWNNESWHKIKRILLGHKFVNIKNWYIISIQSIDTSINNMEQNNCYYLICAEVNGTYIDKNNVYDQMYSKLLVWKSCFYSEEQPYTHE